MVEKITVQPRKIRGLGDIVSPKSTSDFETYLSTISSATETVDNKESTVFTMEYDPLNYEVALSVDDDECYIDESIVLTATVTLDGEPLEDVLVSFRDGTLVKGTDKTDSNGEASIIVSNLSEGVHNFTARYNSATSSSVPVNVSKYTSTISINVSPTTVQSGGNITVSGTCSQNGEITIYVKQVDTVKYMYSNTYTGSYSHTLTMDSDWGDGVYTIYAVYSGSSTHQAVTSSSVTVTVTNLTPTEITLTPPASMIAGTSFNVSGALSIVGGAGIANKYVYVQIDGSGAAVAYSTDSNGAFTVPLTLSAGNHTVSAYFNGGSGLYSSSKTITITVSAAPSFDGISITNTKDVLSYNNGSSPESTTITAQLTNGGSSASVSGETVYFKIWKGHAVIDTLTADTDSTGKASVSYTAQGLGDCSIKCSCNLLTETYATTLQDCLVYDPLTSASGKWTIQSGANATYSSDGMKLAPSSGYNQVKLTEKLTSACSVEFTFVDYYTSLSGYAPVLIYAYTNGETTPNLQIMMGGDLNASTFSCLSTTINHALIKGAKYKIEYTSSTLSVYENDVLLATGSNTVGLPTRFEIHEGGSRMVQIKDVKVKPL